MSDPVNTVRRAPDGVVAVKTNKYGDSEVKSSWLASTYEDRRPNGTAKSFWRSDVDVADWEVIYTPPPPIGTVMRRDVPLGPGKGWEAAVSTEEGWIYLNQNGFLGIFSTAPYDDKLGSWEVLHGRSQA